MVYGYLYLLFTTMTFVFHDQYGISASNIGLVYLGIGLGQFVGLLLFGTYSDKLLRKLAKGGEMKPEYRLPLLWPWCYYGSCGPHREFSVPAKGRSVLTGAVVIALSTKIQANQGPQLYGWTAQYKVHWIVPILGTALLGAGMIGAFVSHPFVSFDIKLIEVQMPIGVSCSSTSKSAL